MTISCYYYSIVILRRMYFRLFRIFRIVTHHIQSFLCRESNRNETNHTTTTLSWWTKKRRSTALRQRRPRRRSTDLLLLLSLALYYAGPPFHRSYGVVGSGGTTRGGAITAAALYGKKNAQEKRAPVLSKSTDLSDKGVDRNDIVMTGQASVPSFGYYACPSPMSYASCTCDIVNHFNMPEKVGVPPSKLVHCPATAPCSTTAMTFTGPNSVCTGMNDRNKGNDNCNDIVAPETIYDVYYNCMEDPSSADGTCAVQNVCERSWWVCRNK